MSAFDAYLEISKNHIARALPHEVMARHTTFRIGGPATAYVECNSVHELTKVIGIAKMCESDWIVVGKGSNLLVSDEGYEGLVLVLGRDFKSFHPRYARKDYEDDLCIDSDVDCDSGREASLDLKAKDGELVPDVMVCGAGMTLGRLVQEAFKNGWSGFEFAVGIPGSLGGAVFMNAGANGSTIGEVVRSVVVLRPGEGLYKYYSSDLPWIYRYSGIPAGEVILEAEVTITKGSKSLMQAKMEGSLRRRKRTQPSGYPNAGSIFRNAPEGSAGKLIEDAGLKGYRVGGAQISDIHANFIVNVDNATAADVVALINVARNRVKELYGIQLQPEIKFLGFK